MTTFINLGGGSGSGWVAQGSAPADTTLLWIDTTNNLLKYYNGSAWTAVGSVWG